MNGDPYCPNCRTIFRSQYEEENDIADEFKGLINNARDYYNTKNYEKAFFYLEYASRIYAKMNRFEKSQVRNNPFNQDWIVELCCMTLNTHGKYKRKATDFIIKNSYDVRLCMDCDCAYPSNYNYCIKCGNPLTNPNGRSPEKIAEELSDILSYKIYDEFASKLVNRSLVLMKSNNCRLVEIADRNYGLDFKFEKEHEYFKTIYTFMYVPNTVRIFEDFTTTQDYEKLLNNESFKKLIRILKTKPVLNLKSVTAVLATN